jgi:hypothetical protein
MTWGWRPIGPDEELAGKRAPAPDELRFEERWVGYSVMVRLVTADQPRDAQG